MKVNKVNQLSDERLLSLIEQGNQLAFNELYNRYWLDMYRLARDLVSDEEVAKDVLQDVFFVLWKKHDQLKISSLKPYLLTATRNASLRKITKEKLTESDDEFLATIPSMAVSVIDQITYEEQHEQIKNLIDDLPGRRREIFYQSRFHHRSNEDIANEMNLSKNTVEWHISKALQHLRFSLKDVSLLLAFLLF